MKMSRREQKSFRCYTNCSQSNPVYCNMRPENCNLPICWAELRGARSRGNAKCTVVCMYVRGLGLVRPSVPRPSLIYPIKCTVTLGFDGTFDDISMVMTFKETFPAQRRCRFRDNGKNQLFKYMSSRQYAKNHPKRVTGRLQTE
jgi:hypothetical protein